MNISSITNTISTKFWKLGLAVKAKSPEILIAAGVGLVIGGTVMACKATSKAKDIVTNRDNEIAKIKEEEAYLLTYSCNTPDTEKEIRKEAKSNIAVENAKCVWSLTKCYAPAFALELAGIGCFLGAHGIMQKRNSALIAAYEATDAAYRKLKDQKEPQQLLTEGEQPKVSKEEQDIIDDLESSNRKMTDDTSYNQYSFFFDELCDSWTPDAEANKYRALLCEQALQKKLDARGFVFLNEVREFFGMDSPGPCAAGQIIGWMKELGDTTIDLGIRNNYQEGARSFINGRSREILITPNCHHVIYNKL